MPISSILGVLFGACGLVSTCLVPYVVLRERKLARQGVTTTGTIVAMEDDNDGGYTAHVRYLVGGQTLTHKAGSRGLYRVGEIVRLRYLPHAPQEASIDEGGRIFAGTITVIVLAVVFWVVAAVFAVLHHFGVA